MSAIAFCLNNGHKLQNYQTGGAIDPVNKVFIPRMEIICSQCGTPFEKIADAKPPRVRSKSKAKIQEPSA